ncbi:hypothetical protein [Actinacidiphila sp. bgisy160]|uniref:hypothetical protein n=1 Tax=Actinacidiphila sp. bgisy160 TaxID=3413796 RepID=UPI003D75AF77
MSGRTAGAVAGPAALPVLVPGCALSRSDPGPPLSGARAGGEAITVKGPSCPGEPEKRLVVRDADADAVGPAALKAVWWASGPTTAAARPGEAELFTGKGFRHSAPQPATVPRRIEVDYVTPGPDGWSEALHVDVISAAKPKPGQYWTEGGVRTAARIDAQSGYGRGGAAQ